MVAPVRFEPDPKYDPRAGIGTFTFDDGSSMYAENPELAAVVASVPDRRLAENTISPAARGMADKFFSRADVTANVPGPPPLPPGNPAITHAETQPGRYAYNPNFREDAQPPREAEPIPVVDMRQGEQAAPAAGGPEIPADVMVTHVPGTPRITREDLKAKAAAGVPVPQTTTEVHEGAPMDPEEFQARLAARTGVRARQVDAERATADAQIARANAERAAAEAQIPVLQRDAAAQQAENARRETDYRHKVAVINDRVNRWANKEIQPFNGNAFAVIGTAIAEGLGAYGATLGRTPNFAHQIVSEAIARNIHAQEDQIAREGLSADNELARLQRDHDMSADQARVALKMIMDKVALQESRRVAAVTGGQDAQLKQQKWEADFGAQALKDDEELLNATMGKTTETTSAKVMQPQAGSAGYDRLATDKEISERLGYRAKSAESLRKIRGEAEPEDVDKDQQEYGKRRGEIVQSREALKAAASTIGIQLNDDGSVTVPKDWDGAAGFGWTASIPDQYLTAEGRHSRQAIDSAVSAYVKAISGAQATDQEREQLKKQLIGQWDSDIPVGLGNAWRRINEQERNIDASFGKPVVESYRKRQGEGSAERKESGGEPY